MCTQHSGGSSAAPLARAAFVWVAIASVWCRSAWTTRQRLTAPSLKAGATGTAGAARQAGAGWLHTHRQQPVPSRARAHTTRSSMGGFRQSSWRTTLPSRQHRPSRVAPASKSWPASHPMPCSILPFLLRLSKEVLHADRQTVIQQDAARKCLENTKGCCYRLLGKGLWP